MLALYIVRLGVRVTTPPRNDCNTDQTRRKKCGDFFFSCAWEAGGMG